MIRVLQVVTHMNRGGLETMIMNYYRNIDKKKIQFDFLVHREKKGQYENEIEQLGGKIYRLPVLNPFSLTYHKALSLFFDRHPEYRIIHVHQDCLSSILLKEAYKHNVPVRIAHSHSCSQDKDYKYPIKLVYKRYIPKYTTHLLACGEMAGKWMFGGADFRVLNNAIDAKKYIYSEQKRTEMRGKLNITNDTLLIGHVGRFSLPKNHTFIIDVFVELLKNKKCKLILLGEGELLLRIKEKVEKLGVTDSVIFAGLQPNVSDYLQAMDVFLFPSIYEGVPVSLIEAQAAGLPCVISNGISPESIKTNLVKSLSLDESLKTWADTVIRVANTNRTNTYSDIQSCGYDIETNAKWLTNFYEKVLES